MEKKLETNGSVGMDLTSEDLTPSEPDDGLTAEERKEKLEWQKMIMARYRRKQREIKQKK
jgi:hypothetical protein